MDNPERVLLILFLSALIYDRAVVDVIERRLPQPHGVTAFEVVIGVLFTLVGFGFLVGLETMILALLCFAASGVPMILGSLQRTDA